MFDAVFSSDSSVTFQPPVGFWKSSEFSKTRYLWFRLHHIIPAIRSRVLNTVDHPSSSLCLLNSVRNADPVVYERLLLTPSSFSRLGYCVLPRNDVTPCALTPSFMGDSNTTSQRASVGGCLSIIGNNKSSGMGFLQCFL